MLTATMRDVTFSYDRDRTVLRGLNLDVRAGEQLAIVGPSGSGKSSLIGLLGGFLTASAGQITVLGHDVSQRRGRHLAQWQTSWVQQSNNILPDRTALDNVALALQMRGADRRRSTSEAQHFLAAVGLADCTDRIGAKLSGGQVQRICIARALVVRPLLLLADEPTGQLDSSTSEDVVRALDAATGAASECATVIVTHDPAVAACCDRVVRLVDGRVDETASTG